MVLPVCYREIVQLGDTATNYQLTAGDRVYVPSRGFWDDCAFFHKKKPDCPCDRPQSACPIPPAGAVAGWPAPLVPPPPAAPPPDGPWLPQPTPLTPAKP